MKARKCWAHFGLLPAAASRIGPAGVPCAALDRHLSDNTAAAVAAWLKTVKPAPTNFAEPHYRVPLPPSYGAPIVHVPAPSRADKVSYGAYLSGPAGHCVLCHTPPGGGKPFDMNLAYLGGRELPDFDHPGGVTISRNITAGSKSGIGDWTNAQIKRAITQGI